MQPRRIQRRRACGTLVQQSWEQERPVSAPALPTGGIRRVDWERRAPQRQAQVSTLESQAQLQPLSTSFGDALRLRADSRPVSIVELAFNVAIRTGPSAHQAKGDACSDNGSQQRRAVPFAMRVETAIDIVGIADVVLSAWMAT
jgi:hypothetical protein